MRDMLDVVLDSQEALALVKGQLRLPPASIPGPRLVDLFCGFGGMTAGALMAAVEQGVNPTIAYAADIDPVACGVYRENFSPFLDHLDQDDISRKFSSAGAKISREEKEFVRKVGAVDMLFAGPPCQGHSDLNNSTRRLDPRNELYYVVIRVAELLRPGCLVIENVPGVIHSKEKVVQRSIDFLRGMGYSVQEGRVDFLRYGIPQRRRRHVLLASRTCRLADALQPRRTAPQPELRDWLAKLPRGGNPLLDRVTNISAENSARINFLFDHDLYDLPDELRPNCHSKKAHSYKSVYGRLSWRSPAQTLTSGFGSAGQGRYIHPREKRTITAREALRIQGVPDWLTFESVRTINDLRRLIANAVPPLFTYNLMSYWLRMMQRKSA